MRHGEYTRLDNMDYELFCTQENKYKIILRTHHASVSGFNKLDEGVFGKVIWDNSLITNAYYVRTCATYKGFDFQVESYVGQMYLLVTDSYDTYRRLNLEQRDRGEYQIYVDKK